MAASWAVSASASDSTSVSASTDIPLKEKYDVFLSFRGPDTRRGFTSHLHKALKDKKIETYIDYNLERGEEIAPALLEAIERSVISVVVFSPTYAFSRWCLDELVHIMKCKKKFHQKKKIKSKENDCGRYVIPIFYETVVSDIRHQTGNYDLEERFKDRTESERLKWKVALGEAANLGGIVSKTFRDDAKLVEEVVKDIWSKLYHESLGYEFRGFVGLESRVQELESLLRIVPQDDRVRVVGIWGMGGIGKTTLATVVFHRLSRQFDSSCLLVNVREGSGTDKMLRDLRNELLRKLLNDTSLDIEGDILDSGTARKLGRKKVLVVLDDVNDSRQLDILIGQHFLPFGPGSRIIITSRDKRQLDEIQGDSHDVVIYKVKELDDSEAIQLLRLQAPTDNLMEVVEYAKGVPLALRTLRSLFHKGLLNQKEKICSEKLRNVYKVSYDVLTEDEQNIFLDIACFHKGEEKEAVKGLYCDDSSVSSGISALVEMSLIELRKNKLWMHDIIQEMGREIVRQQCPAEPGKRTRLYTWEDVHHVLLNNRGTETVQAISTKGWEWWDRLILLNLNPHVFRKMYNLRFLDLESTLPQGLEFLPDSLRYLSWPGFPLRSLPPSFSADFLVELHMPGSELQTLEHKDQIPRHLKVINLSNSRKLIEIPWLTNLKGLVSIDLRRCYSLVQFPNLSESLNIVSIDLEDCKKLAEVPSYIANLHKLTVLNLRGCSLLKCIPEMPSNMEFLLMGKRLWDGQDVELSGLPSSIWSLKKLIKLDLHGCAKVKNFPSSIWMLESLTSLDLSYTMITDLSSSIEGLSSVVSIKLQHCDKLESLSYSIGNLKSLQKLDLFGCESFVSLSTRICKLKSLEVLTLTGCRSFELFPEILEPMESLRRLCLGGTKIQELPESIENLIGLEQLWLLGCKSLVSVPNSIQKLRLLKNFQAADCCELKKLPNPSSRVLLSLQSELDLSGCTSLEEFPDELMNCLISLTVLDLSGTKIKSIPTSIKERSGLRSLNISNCEHLEALPELPYLLHILNAAGCRKLEMVSFSLTAATQGLDRISDANFSYGNSSPLMEKYSFRGCQKLSETAKTNMMDDAQIRIMRMAAARSILEQTNPGYRPRDEDYSVAIVYSGSEIPKQFMCQADGSSINIKLPLHPSQTNTYLWQLILCAVFTVHGDGDMPGLFPRFKSNFTTNNGDGSEYNFTLPYFIYSRGYADDKSHVYVWNCSHWSTHFRNASEVSFNFGFDPAYGYDVNDYPDILVKRCGVWLLSSQGEEVKLVEVNQDV